MESHTGIDGDDSFPQLMLMDYFVDLKSLQND